MDVKTAEEMGGKVVAAVKSYVARALAPIATRLGAVETRTGALSMMLGKQPQIAEKLSAFEALEARIKALEERPVMEYRGVWSPDESYQTGNLATHGGSMFYCWATTRGKPGETDDWQLCVKRGRDAR